MENSITDRDERVDSIGVKVKRFGFVALVAIAAIALIATGGVAAQEELTNETVTVDNDTSAIYADLTFNASASADVDLEDLDGDKTFSTVTLSGNDSETVSQQWDYETDLLEENGDYRVTVTANETDVDTIDVGTLQFVSGGSGGFLSGDGPAGLSIGAIVILGAGFLYLRGD